VPQPTEKTKKLIHRLKKLTPPETESTSTIHVDYIASKVASFYEKIRKVLDYQEEHLFRKNAIERILRRRLLIQFHNAKKIAHPLICDIIRAGYLPNDTIPETRLSEVEKIITKYILLIKATSSWNSHQKEEMFDWLINLAACEIEESLVPPVKDEALAKYMYEAIRPKITLKNASLSEEEINTQLFIAIEKALLRANEKLLNYRLLKWHWPDWNNISPDLLSQVSTQLPQLKQKLFQEIHHPFGPQFFQLCNQYKISFLVLGDVLLKNPTAINTPEELEKLTREAYQKRYEHSKAKLRRAAVYSTLSIFLSKILIALAIEIPFDLYITHQLILINTAINIFFPPFLMFLIVSTIKPPQEENAQKVILEVMKIAYQQKNGKEYEIKKPLRRGWFLKGIINLFYLITFIFSFGLIIWLLDKLDFSWLSTVIFLIFISLICFTGLKIRQQAKELTLGREKESVWVFFIDLFATPLVQVGKWLSHQWNRFNILVIFFNLILEVPFQLFVEFLENWHRFLKEKKEEIQ